MIIEAEWKWARVNEKELARFVSPRLVSQALGRVSPATYRKVYDWDSDEMVASMTSRDYDASVPLSQESDLTDFDLLKNRPRLARRIYNRLRDAGIVYQLQPITLDDHKQSIRSPAQVVGGVDADGEGTCLDVALVYAGACLDRHLLPLVVVFSDHALTMVAINHDRRDVDGYRPEDAVFENGLATDGKAIHELVTGSKSHLAIECTGFASSSTLPGRNKKGFLSFDKAIVAGAAAIGERTFRFAIDPFWLHRTGIEPVHRDPELSHPTERAVVGARRTNALAHNVAEFSPALLKAASPQEINDLKGALKEIEKTYNIVRKVTKRWISAALSERGGLDSDLMSELITGNIADDIHKGRGSCGKIYDIYERSLKELIDRAITDKEEQNRMHTAFVILFEADDFMFESFEAAGGYLQNEAEKMVALYMSGNTGAAQRRLASNYNEVARFQQAINESHKSLRQAKNKLL